MVSLILLSMEAYTWIASKLKENPQLDIEALKIEAAR
jgi:hypothetical protein